MDIRVDWPIRGHAYTKEEISVVAEVMNSTDVPLTQGENVQKFEKEFAAYLNTDYAFSTMSCAHSLDIAAMLADIQPGDEVVIPAHTYCASAISFARCGAVIKWADIDSDSLTMSPESLKKLVSNKTKAIVLVHLYGLLSPHVLEIAEFAKQKNIILIEDCAQALGAKLGDSHCGTFGDIGCYSFHAQKNLTTLGEGGMLTVKSPLMANKIPGLRLNGHAPFTNKSEYWLPAMGNVDQDLDGVWPMKSSMSETQAAVGRLVLKRLDNLTEQRRKRGLAFRDAMKDFPELKFQTIHASEAQSHHLLPARYDGKNKTRDDLIRILSTEYGVKTIIQYYPLNRYDLFKKTGHAEADIPETDMFFDNMISFPFSIVLSDADFNYMLKSVKAALQQLRGM
jgi:perosamine synthetase